MKLREKRPSLSDVRQHIVASMKAAVEKPGRIVHNPAGSVEGVYTYVLALMSVLIYESSALPLSYFNEYFGDAAVSELFRAMTRPGAKEPDLKLLQGYVSSFLEWEPRHRVVSRWSLALASEDQDLRTAFEASPIRVQVEEAMRKHGLDHQHLLVTHPELGSRGSAHVELFLLSSPLSSGNEYERNALRTIADLV